MTLYAIAVSTSDIGTHDTLLGQYTPGRIHKPRYWGAGDATYLWFTEAAAQDYLERLDDGHFTGKNNGWAHQVDDAFVTSVDADLLAQLKEQGSVFFPWFAEQAFSDEGYTAQHEYLRKQYNVYYTTVTGWEVNISAENEEQARQLIYESATPTSCIDDDEGFECEPHFHDTEIGEILSVCERP